MCTTHLQENRKTHENNTYKNVRKETVQQFSATTQRGHTHEAQTQPNTDSTEESHNKLPNSKPKKTKAYQRGNPMRKEKTNGIKVHNIMYLST
jgi:hypothetical protein